MYSRTCIMQCHARFHAAYFLPAAPRISVSREGEPPPRPSAFALPDPCPENARDMPCSTPLHPSAVAPQPRVAPKAALHPRSSMRTTPSPSCDQVNPPDAGKTRTHRAACTRARDVSCPDKLVAASCVLPHHHRYRWRAREISRFRSTCSLMDAADGQRGIGRCVCAMVVRV